MNPFAVHHIEHLSISQLNLWAAAPAVWVMERLLGRKTPVGAAAHRGTAVEAALLPRSRAWLNHHQSFHTFTKLATLPHIHQYTKPPLLTNPNHQQLPLPHHQALFSFAANIIVAAFAIVAAARYGGNKPQHLVANYEDRRGGQPRLVHRGFGRVADSEQRQQCAAQGNTFVSEPCPREGALGGCRETAAGAPGRHHDLVLRRMRNAEDDDIRMLCEGLASVAPAGLMIQFVLPLSAGEAKKSNPNLPRLTHGREREDADRGR